MSLNCTPAQVVGKLVIQIKKLVHDPAHPLKTPERSPLFQIAAFIETPKLATPQNPGPNITGQTFARIRDEALRPHDNARSPGKGAAVKRNRDCHQPSKNSKSPL